MIVTIDSYQLITSRDLGEYSEFGVLQASMPIFLSNYDFKLPLQMCYSGDYYY